ncbi:Cyclic nucleotide-binding domain-containing protein [Desulfuromusa kysingii]|uniref:Cyclic nucleotide-binding domain-containing protein n=1 Tax=Desulfuromusa kysingii TaxID=37625 RepID=A0A1H4BP03_9BACT|nr:cyclic nucleotide-binding domain-containing protein [Desulfuromusa kysingii]SEA49850.1 Cyclic nucleotide-binding domain-containing protein [Desulfuromusa kysingii]
MSLVNLTELSGSPLFEGLAAKEIEYLGSIFTAKQIAEGKTVFVENMPGESLYLIQQGTVKISQMLAEVDEVDLMTLTSGDVFGEMAVIDGGNRQVRARISENATLFILHRSRFNTLVSEHPRLGLQLTLNIVRLFSARIRRAKKDYRAMLTVSLARKR